MQRRLSTRDGALLGALVPLGWSLHDHAVFLISGRPIEAVGLILSSVVAVVLGALLGAAFARRRSLLFAALAAALVAALLANANRSSLSQAERHLPRMLFVAFGAWGAAAFFRARGARLATWRLGLSAGVLACALHTAVYAVLRSGKLEVSSWLGLAAVAALALGFARRSSARRVATALAVLAPACWVAWRAWDDSKLPRADLPRPAAREPAADAANLLLIVLDTVRADHLSFYGHERETTPSIDAFAREHAVAYLNARSSCSETVPSHASLFTGLQARPAQYLFARPESPEAQRPTLADILREQGYRTGAIIANGMLTHELGLDRGFEHYDDRKSAWVGSYLALGQLRGKHLLLGHKPYRDGAVITALALSWIDSVARDGPFFLAVNYMDAHGPYIPPPPYDRFFGDDAPRDPLVNDEVELFPLLYDRSLRYLDEQVARLLAGLEERGLFDPTIVILTSDHGEAFGEHGLWSHGWMLYEELIRVPLFVKPITARAEARIAEPTPGARVYHIALRELGLEAPAALDDVVPEVIGEWHYGRVRPFVRTILARSELERDLVTWFEGGIKFIVSSKGAVEAYDLERDPLERAPLTLGEETVEAARGRARRWWDAQPKRKLDAPQFDDDTLRRLQELGYVEGSR